MEMQVVLLGIDRWNGADVHVIDAVRSPLLVSGTCAALHPCSPTMSARMLQRALRSHGKLKLCSPSASDDEDSDSIPSRREAVSNSFDLLGISDDQDELEESIDANESFVSEKPTSFQQPSSKKAKKKKKKKGKAKILENPADDDVDQLLEGFTVSEKYNCVSTSTSTETRGKNSVMGSKSNKALIVDIKHLRAEDELKRIFGSKVINAVERSNSNYGGARRRQAMGRKIGKGNMLRKTVLVSPKDYWPSWDGSISMEHTGMKDGLQEFKYTFSSSYMETQKSYELSGASYDPNTIALLLIQHPYHLESLLSLSEVYKQLGEYQQSVECLERCIFALECAWHPLFNPFNGTCRLPFSCDTNKLFFSALFKHMQHLGRRGCHRSALEVCKLILSMDADDPLGSLFSIDYFALRAEQYDWLEWFVEEYSNDTALWLLPNFSFSSAVARYYLEQQQKEKKGFGTGPAQEAVSSHSLLKQALMLHPATLRKVVDKAPIKEDAEWARVLRHPHFKKATPGGPSLEHLISLYVERNHLIWRVPDLQAQLKNAALAVLDAADNDSGEVSNWACVRQETFSSETNEYRHLHFSEFSDSAPPMPPEELQNMMFRGDGNGNDGNRAMHMVDNGLNNAVDDGLNNATTLQGRNAVLVFLQSLLPWTNYGTDLHGEDVELDGGDGEGSDVEENNG